jgi:NAD(P)-dependent dehydrogenase (short-subunit alcohol dehydrogenase family)
MRGTTCGDAATVPRPKAPSVTGRIGEPDDIAAAICTITSETAGWITAQRIEASGGQSL